VSRHLGEGATGKLRLLEQAGVAERQADGSWKLVEVTSPQAATTAPLRKLARVFSRFVAGTSKSKPGSVCPPTAGPACLRVGGKR
jgi:hypothetical protein